MNMQAIGTEPGTLLKVENKTMIITVRGLWLGFTAGSQRP